MHTTELLAPPHAASRSPQSQAANSTGTVSGAACFGQSRKHDWRHQLWPCGTATGAVALRWLQRSMSESHGTPNVGGSG